MAQVLKEDRTCFAVDIHDMLAASQFQHLQQLLRTPNCTRVTLELAPVGSSDDEQQQVVNPSRPWIGQALVHKRFSADFLQDI